MDLTVIGNACVDIYVPAHEPPAPGGVTFLDAAVDFQVGGNAANAAIVASRLGSEVEMLGVLGDDPMGDIVRGKLRTSGVSIDRLRIEHGRTSPTTVVVNDPGGERAFVHHPGTNASWGSLPAAGDVSSRVLLFSGVELLTAIWPETAIDMAREFSQRARAKGRDGAESIVAFDPFVDDNIDPKEIAETHAPFLEYVDIVFPNEGEALALTATTELDDAVARFHQLGVSVVVVKRGEHGARLSTIDRTLELGADSVPVLDTCGAGDNFVAGFLSARIEGLPLEACLERGCALGTLCVQFWGAVTGSEDPSRLRDALP